MGISLREIANLKAREHRFFDFGSSFRRKYLFQAETPTTVLIIRLSKSFH
jgi:hypothetical protein